jgi:DNA-binding beta-propeller fold protein YncE
MRHPKRWIGIWILSALLLTGCQTAPRVPEVLGTVKVKMFGGGGAVAINVQTGYVYIAGSQHITILKGTEMVGEVETGGEKAISMGVDETNDLLYVVDERSDNVTVIRGKERIGVVPTIGKQPTSVAIDPRSQFAYVVSGYGSRPLGGDIQGNILVLLGTQVIANIKVDGRVLLTRVVADPVGGYIYAGSGNTIVVFKELQEVARHSLPAISAMTANPHTGEVYALAEATLYRFKEGRLIDSVRLENNPRPVWTIAAHPITGDVYIPYGWSKQEGGGHVLVLRDMKEIANIDIGGLGALVASAIDPLTGNVYLASFDADTVTVLNGTKVLKVIEVGWYPHGVGVNAKNGWVYVSNINDGTVTILGYPQGKSTAPTLTETTPVTPKRPPSTTYP